VDTLFAGGDCRCILFIHFLPGKTDRDLGSRGKYHLISNYLRDDSVESARPLLDDLRKNGLKGRVKPRNGRETAAAVPFLTMVSGGFERGE